jgi:hypothetical protein
VAKNAEAVSKVAKEVDEQRKALGANVGSLLWLQDVVEHDYPAAANYLSLIGDQHTVQAIVDALRKAPIEQHRANDILRAAKLDLLPLDDLSVKRDLGKVLLGRQWSPVLVVRGDVLHDYPLTIADGYHRVCASYHLSEDTYIPCKIVDLPVPEKLSQG